MVAVPHFCLTITHTASYLDLDLIQARGAPAIGGAIASTAEDLGRRATALEHAQGETTETLRWVVTKLARTQAVQDEHTLRLERLESKVDKLDGRLDNVETRLEKVETRLEKVETRLGKVETGLEALPRTIAEMIAEMVDSSEKRIMAAIAGRG
jgi:chromosome segregation ATPase